MFPDTKSALIQGIIVQSAFKRSLIPAIIRFFFHPLFFPSLILFASSCCSGATSKQQGRRKKLCDSTLSSHERRWHGLTDADRKVTQRRCSRSSGAPCGKFMRWKCRFPAFKALVDDWCRRGRKVTLPHMAVLRILTLATGRNQRLCELAFLLSLASLAPS